MVSTRGIKHHGKLKILCRLKSKLWGSLCINYNKRFQYAIVNLEMKKMCLIVILRPGFKQICSKAAPRIYKQGYFRLSAQMCFMSMIINPSKLLAQKKKFVVNIEPLRSGLNNTVPPLRRNIRRSTIDPKIHFLIKIFFNFKFATLFFLR